jgi:hypothetical protein
MNGATIMNRKRFAVIAAAVAVTTAACTVGIAAQPTSRLDIATVSADAGLRALLTEQAATDRVPAHVSLGDHGEGGIVASTVRRLGSDSRGNYFLSADASGNVCLTVTVEGTEVSATTCGTPQQVAEGGLSLAAYGPGTSPVWTEAYLVPDGATVSNVPSALSRLTPNLLVGDSRGVKGTARELSVERPSDRSGTPEFTLELVPPPSFS